MMAAMHNAAARGDEEVILYLLSKGAAPKAVNREGKTTGTWRTAGAADSAVAGGAGAAGEVRGGE
jgi:hypothetical protein